MPQIPDGPRRSLLGEVKDAVSVRAAVLAIGVPALRLAFATSYISASHKPKPHEIPPAVTSPSASRAPPTGC